MRVLQSNRSKPKEAFRADLMKWHSTVRELLVRMSAGSEAYYAKWAVFFILNASTLINPECISSLILKKMWDY